MGQIMLSVAFLKGMGLCYFQFSGLGIKGKHSCAIIVKKIQLRRSSGCGSSVEHMPCVCEACVLSLSP